MDDFADQLAGAAGKDDLGSVLSEWLLERDEIDDVFADDDRLAATVIEQARRLAAEGESARTEAKRAPDPLAFLEMDDEGTDEGHDEWVARWSRSSFLPKTREGDGPVTASKFGGAAFLREGEAWPSCPGCEQPMNLFVQLDLSTLPPGLSYPHREGMVQLFYCTSAEPLCEVDHEAWQPFGKSVVARWLSPEELAGPAAPAQDPIGLPVALVQGWEPGASELPGYEEDVPLPESMEDLDDDQQPNSGDKLGGWPAWVQGPEYPTCPECKTTMVHLLQLESNGLCRHQFGDLGTGHLCQCPNHPQVVAFGWACH
ncbi:DUF1963 domain-containing protein [Paraliomyxa miuraensis]|uniref:DUF1963 domain-containing protein n=1 Tax=Paraliomyxa miuraensis TaxID=376150 RepID=UPI00225A76B1|nr:DUF1963 domain-containing protein [Paraliomyxa miuraensis]MCX4241113.1 YwqG family protein [Paraliomyxa miuraensis]